MISFFLYARSVASTNATTGSRARRSGGSGYDSGETRSLVVTAVVFGGVGVTGWSHRRHSSVVGVTRVGWCVVVVSTDVSLVVGDVLVLPVDSDG